jgi:pullulanase/glycogen debranching enzyme
MTVLAANRSKSAGLETQSGDEIRAGSPLPFGAHQEGRKSPACLILGQSDADLFLMFNADTAPADFSIPPARSDKVWRLAADTSRLAPDDLYEPGEEPSMQDQVNFRVEPRSSAILFARG